MTELLRVGHSLGWAVFGFVPLVFALVVGYGGLALQAAGTHVFGKDLSRKDAAVTLLALSVVSAAFWLAR